MSMDKYNLGVPVGSKGGNQGVGGRRRTCALNGRCCVGRASCALPQRIEKRPLAAEGAWRGWKHSAVAGKLASLSDVIGYWLCFRPSDNLGDPANI